MAAAPYALPPLLQIDQRGYRAASLIGEVLQPRAVFIASAGRLIVPCSHSEPSREVSTFAQPQRATMVLP
jgi:hypothetical protein